VFALTICRTEFCFCLKAANRIGYILTWSLVRFCGVTSGLDCALS
jgi:hypothetical protein